MDFGSLMALYALLVGLALGSFMNVCIYRIPLQKSIVRPSSSCPNCGKKIRFYDNIPIISYLLLFGRCRHCRHPISWRYPVIEAITGLLSLALFIRYGLSFQYLLFLLFAATLVTISFIDLDHQIIPDVLSISGIIAGLAAAFVPGNVSWFESVIGIIGGGGALFFVGLIYEKLTGKQGMGGGDVKLLAMIGAWMGWRSLPFVLLISSLTGAIIGSVFLLAAGKGYRVKIPFGPFLSLGALSYIFFGPQLTNWYIGLLL